MAHRHARATAFAAAVAILQSGCVALPRAAEYRSGTLPAAATPRQAATLTDGRTRFRAVFCALRQRAADADPADPRCERLLWRMTDEAPAPAEVRDLPPMPSSSLRFVLVTGAFDDCYGDEGLPFREAAQGLAARGYRLDTVRLSGRSSAIANAEALSQAVRPMLADPEVRLVLIGYSKGAVDILELLAAHRDLAARVEAVVSVAGPVHGTPLAAEGAFLYDALLSHSFAARCDPGDGGVLDSLDPAVRAASLAAAPPPVGVRMYSVLALPESGLIARALTPSWEMLARSSRYNDGQVRVQDGLIPGGTLLGFANADHWGIALRIERVLPHIAARDLDRPFPQHELLEAIMLTVGAAVSQNGGTPVHGMPVHGE